MEKTIKIYRVEPYMMSEKKPFWSLTEPIDTIYYKHEYEEWEVELPELYDVVDRNGLTLVCDGAEVEFIYTNGYLDTFTLEGVCHRLIPRRHAYIVQDKGTGTFIDWFDTVKGAKDAVDNYLREDEKDGFPSDDFYEIVECLINTDLDYKEMIESIIKIKTL